MPELGGAEEDDLIECLTCMDTGEYVAPGSYLLLPCPSCERGIWNDILETADDARREQMREDTA